MSKTIKNILTVITKTTREAAIEKKFYAALKRKQTTCPCCGHVSEDNYNPFGIGEVGGDQTEISISYCPYCGTEWKTFVENWGNY